MTKDKRENFKNNNFVSPLYRYFKNGNKIKPKTLVTVDTNYNLDGNGLSVKKKVVTVNNVQKLRNNKECKVYLPNSCENIHRCHITRKYRNNTRTFRDRIKDGRKMLGGIENSNEIVGKQDKTNKLVQSEDKGVLIQTVPNTWLRLYPTPKLAEESVCSVVFRCILSQLGLSTILVLWTFIWVFIIHSFEGPYEMKVSLDFEKEQNQLVIALATELRQTMLLMKIKEERCEDPVKRSAGVWRFRSITPLSPRWKNIIEQRIQEERKLTLDAVSNGARVQPGQFWDLSGTFLFTIYVMTALGFGAPVPQTIWGRTSGLSYAIVAVPTHVYLMLNASTCIVVHVQAYINRLKRRLQDKPFFLGRTTLDYGRESPNCSRNSELLKTEPKRHRVSKRILKSLGVLGACRSVPLAALSYYVCGAIAFGILREKEPLEVIMFPLEFTTSGGLDHVRGHVRILYGFYIEGAMILLACAVATVRRHSNAAINTMSEKYRLFACEY